MASSKTCHLAKPHFLHLQSGANCIKLSPQERWDYFSLKLVYRGALAEPCIFTEGLLKPINLDFCIRPARKPSRVCSQVSEWCLAQGHTVEPLPGRSLCCAEAWVAVDSEVLIEHM